MTITSPVIKLWILFHVKSAAAPTEVQMTKAKSSQVQRDVASSALEFPHRGLHTTACFEQLW